MSESLLITNLIHHTWQVVNITTTIALILPSDLTGLVAFRWKFPKHNIHYVFPLEPFLLAVHLKNLKMQEGRRFNGFREQKCCWWVTDQVKRGLLRKKRGGGGWGWGLEGCRNSSQDKWCVLQGCCGTVCVLETDMSDVILTSDVVLLIITQTTINRVKSVQRSCNLCLST